MPIAETLPVRVSAAAYLRLELSTGAADVIHGAQVAAIIDDGLHAGHDITPGNIMIQVRDTKTRRSIQYVAVRQSGVGRDIAERYTFSTCPNAKTVLPRGVVRGLEMRKATNAARGEVYTLLDGTVVSVYAGRCAARWVPLPAAEMESK